MDTKAFTKTQIVERHRIIQNTRLIVVPRCFIASTMAVRPPSFIKTDGLMMIIVSGLPGSGKSYFASRLAKELDARYVSSDLTRKDLDASGHYAFDDKLNIYEEMARRAGDYMRRSEHVVVDATFYRREMRDLFFTLASLLHQKVAHIEIVADEALVRERLSVPRLDSEADYSVYEHVRAQYEKPDNEHLALESGADNIESMLARGRNYIRVIDERS